MLTLQQLEAACDSAAALRLRRRLQPAGGVGDKIFPPTYPGAGQNAPPRHVFELRRIDGQDVACVLIDSVQSQANRLEEALLAAAKAGRIALPRLVVDFHAAGLDGVEEISSLEAPHRIFDAILRDSAVDGKPFRESRLGVRLRLAKPGNATAILESDPAALPFGAWNSTSEGGGLGAKFTRAIVSEIVAINVQKGARAGVRVDPLGILASVKIKGDVNNWEPAGDSEKAAKRPSEINHSNVIAGAGKGSERQSVWEQGVTCDYAEQVAVISFAGLRRLAFGDDPRRNRAARAYIAALGMVALMELEAQGYALRSRCDLVAEGEAPLQLVRPDGKTETVELRRDEAVALHAAAFKSAREAGFDLRGDPIVLKPQDKLVEIVRRSQQKALQDGGGSDEAG